MYNYCQGKNLTNVNLVNRGGGGGGGGNLPKWVGTTKS